MSLYTFETQEPSPAAAKTLGVLADAVGDRVVPAGRRVMASSDSRSPDEGLALLSGYVAIEDSAVRQAILDTIMAIAGSNPYR